MSDNYYKVKMYYDQNLWSKNAVKKAVGKWITEDEYIQIVGVEKEDSNE